MRILVVGAGVLGSLYAARLHRTGQDVTLLARGQRLEELRARGVVLESATTGRRSTTWVPVVDRLGPDDRYDAILVLVRKTQLDGVIPMLAANHASPSVVVMVSNAEGPAALAAALGRDRLVLGFAGAGGTISDGVVSFEIVPGYLQPTVLGELDGAVTPRLHQLRRALRAAGFSVSIQRDMDAWLKTHEVWICAVANAIYAADGDRMRLARTPDAVVMMFRAIVEGLEALRSLGVVITPTRFGWLRWVPEPLAVAVLTRVVASMQAEVLAVRHANAARDDEMRRLSAEVGALLADAPSPAPTWFELARYGDPAIPPMPDGSSRFSVH